MATSKPTPDDQERRIAPAAPELRKTGEGLGTLVGMAAVFSSETTIGGSTFGWREQLAPRAFDSALSRPDDVRALWNHDPNVVLGRTKSNTLRLSRTKDGLKYEIDLPDTQAARDVLQLISRGDVSGSSFGFRVLDDEWDESAVKSGKLPLRTITDVELWDVSPVAYPAYPETSVNARSKAQAIAEAQAKAEAEQPDEQPPEQTDDRTAEFEAIRARIQEVRDKLPDA